MKFIHLQRKPMQFTQLNGTDSLFCNSSIDLNLLSCFSKGQFSIRIFLKIVHIIRQYVEVNRRMDMFCC